MTVGPGRAGRAARAYALLLVDVVIEALAAQQDELSRLLAGLTDGQWRTPTRCDGWDVSDVVLHLAQSNEVSIASATGRFAEAVAELTVGLAPSGSVDEGAGAMVARQRGLSPSELRERWSSSTSLFLDIVGAMDLSTRVTWVAGELSTRTLVTARLAETWIHSVDVAEAVGVPVAPTEHLFQIARLAWRTLPYAFSSAGRALSRSGGLPADVARRRTLGPRPRPTGRDDHHRPGRRPLRRRCSTDRSGRHLAHRRWSRRR